MPHEPGVGVRTPMCQSALLVTLSSQEATNCHSSRTLRRMGITSSTLVALSVTSLPLAFTLMVSPARRDRRNSGKILIAVIRPPLLAKTVR